MRIQITCEKCNRLILEGKGYKDAEHLARRFSHDGWCAPLECPYCAKLTHGPLTEELVAEALIAVADKWMGGIPKGSPGSMQKWLAVAEARFVLRLLEEMERARVNDGHPWQLDHEREWLFELAGMG